MPCFEPDNKHYSDVGYVLHETLKNVAAADTSIADNVEAGHILYKWTKTNYPKTFNRLLGPPMDLHFFLKSQIERVLHMLIHTDLEHRFNANVGAIHTDIRNSLKEIAHNILDLTPPGREQSLAITKLEEVMFWANAAVARRSEVSPGPMLEPPKPPVVDDGTGSNDEPSPVPETPHTEPSADECPCSEDQPHTSP